MIAITKPLPRERREDGRIHGQRVVVMTEPGGIRIQHCETQDQARACESAWRAGNLRYWPGEFRPIKEA